MKPIFITLHDKQHSFEVNANLIIYMQRMLREEKTVVYFDKDYGLTVIETPEQITHLISESN